MMDGKDRPKHVEWYSINSEIVHLVGFTIESTEVLEIRSMRAELFMGGGGETEGRTGWHDEADSRFSQLRERNYQWGPLAWHFTHMKQRTAERIFDEIWHHICILSLSTHSSSVYSLINQCTSKEGMSAFLRISRVHVGRTVTRAMCRRLITAEARSLSEVSRSEICGVQSGTWTGLFYPCQYHSINSVQGDQKVSVHLTIVL